MVINFDDTDSRDQLYPFTTTRSAADIRVGIITIREKWNLLVEKKLVQINNDSTLPSNVIPGISNAAELLRLSAKDVETCFPEQVLQHPWQIFQFNDREIKADFDLITTGRSSAPISPTNQVSNPSNIFIEEGAKVEHSMLNANTGPIYIGRNAEVMEGCLVRGAFALCEGAVLKMGSKVYGATTIGPYCVAGGELKNVVLFEYSNKAHDGYLGDSVLGAWCNLGAGTSNSNVLNTAGDVKVWDHAANNYVQVGLKCGLLMGDYSRAAINTSFNTGTVVGVCCNVYGSGFPPKFIPDFTWGKERYTFENATRHINNWKKLKGYQLSEHELNLLHHLYNNEK